MGWRFRKTKRFGPFSISLTHRGITTSVGVGGLRYQLTGPGKGRSRTRRQTENAKFAQVESPQGNSIAEILVLSFAIIFAAYLFGRATREDKQLPPAPASTGAPYSADSIASSTAPAESSPAPFPSTVKESKESEVSTATPIEPLATVATPTARIASVAPLAIKTKLPSRLWVSKSGKFTVRASVADIRGDTIYLLRDDGKLIVVPIARLCDEDAKFARAQKTGDAWTGEVIGVAHGDAITVRRSDTTFQVRLAGIDAPERGQTFAQESRKALHSKLYCQFVTVESLDRQNDGTVRGHVLLDGRWVNYDHVTDGWAWNRGDSIVFADAESEAREAKVGLWADNYPTPPWEFIPPAPVPTSRIASDEPKKQKTPRPRRSYNKPRTPMYAGPYIPSPYVLGGNSGGGGTVHVRGYYRKDGTYVRPHTRRSPR